MIDVKIFTYIFDLKLYVLLIEKAQSKLKGLVLTVCGNNTYIL